MGKFILPEGIEATEEVITLWKGKNNYFREKELAESELAIARECDKCGESTSAPYRFLCDKCIEIHSKDRYMQKPEKVWDGKTPLVIYGTDIYFYDEDEVFDYCEENEVEVSSLQLVICKRVQVPTFEIASFLEDIHDWDYDIPNENHINDEVNAILDKYLESFNYWEEGKYRTTLED